MDKITAQVTKTFCDGTVDIDTMPIDIARAHVVTRTTNPDSYGIERIAVQIGRDTHRWAQGFGWVRNCDNADVEHPGFPCVHPVRHTVA